MPPAFISIRRGSHWAGPPGIPAAWELPLQQGGAPPAALFLTGGPGSGKTLTHHILLQALAPSLLAPHEDPDWGRLLPVSPPYPPPRAAAPRSPVRAARLPAERVAVPEAGAVEGALFEVLWSGKTAVLRAERAAPKEGVPGELTVRLTPPGGPGTFRLGAVLRAAPRPSPEEEGLSLLMPGGQDALGPEAARPAWTKTFAWLSSSWLQGLGFPDARVVLTRDPPALGSGWRVRGWAGAPLGHSRAAALRLLLAPFHHLVQVDGVSRSITGLYFVEEPEAGLPPAAWPLLMPVWRKVWGTGLIWVSPSWQAEALASSAPGDFAVLNMDPARKP